jgi:hypothetical protein
LQRRREIKRIHLSSIQVLALRWRSYTAIAESAQPSRSKVRASSGRWGMAASRSFHICAGLPEFPFLVLANAISSDGSS